MRRRLFWRKRHGRGEEPTSELVQLAFVKHPRRWRLYSLAALSLFLAMATVVCWVLSYAISTQVGCHRLIDPFHHPPEKQEAEFYDLDSTQGVLGFGYTDEKGEMIPVSGWKFDISHDATGGGYYDPARTVLTRLGFHAWSQSWNGGRFDTRVVAVHYWFLLVLFVIVFGVVVKKIRSLDPIAGFCADCGYDLRATPGRCPECGTIAKINEMKRV